MPRFNPSRRRRFLAGASTWAVMISLKPEAWVAEQDAERSSRV